MIRTLSEINDRKDAGEIADVYRSVMHVTGAFLGLDSTVFNLRRAVAALRTGSVTRQVFNLPEPNVLDLQRAYDTLGGLINDAVSVLAAIGKARRDIGEKIDALANQDARKKFADLFKAGGLAPGEVCPDCGEVHVPLGEDPSDEARDEFSTSAGEAEESYDDSVERDVPDAEEQEAGSGI
jgi:hypothetical protein